MSKRDMRPAGTNVEGVKTKGRTQGECRICFGINWFELEDDATAVDASVRKQGLTYNGGWFHGMACGRDRSFDFTDADGVRWYAVTY
jgi:hypothetical protein